MPEKEFVEEDPMELVGMVIPGEAGQLESMAETIVEEYVRMGWDEKRLMTLFPARCSSERTAFTSRKVIICERAGWQKFVRNIAISGSSGMGSSITPDRLNPI